MRHLLIGTIAALAVGLGAAPVAQADLQLGDFTEAQDTAFTAALTKQGLPHPDDIWLAGQSACLMLVNEDAGLIETTAWVMDSWEITGKQAIGVVSVAIDTYCPGAR